MLICVALMLACVLTFVACNEGTTPADTTAETTATTQGSEDATVADTEASQEDATVAETDASEETEGEDVTLGLGSGDFDPETHVVISTAEELMAFNTYINSMDIYADFFWDMTVVFTADIDMTGYEWTPLNGRVMDCVTFDGQGHTISNLQFKEYKVAAGTPAEDMGCGFIDVATGSLYFKDLTLDHCTIVANERAVGNFVGLAIGSGIELSFENCHSTNFTLQGWWDIKNTSAEEQITIHQRGSGFIGHVMAGVTSVFFKDCSTENANLQGFQNLAGFIGYDGASIIDQYCFENCKVSGCTFSFGYGSKWEDKTPADHEKKYVSVFYNGSDWSWNVEACVDLGNTYEDIVYIDIFNDNYEYMPNDFRTVEVEPAA